MFAAISRLFGAFGRLADNINALADTAGEANSRLRERLTMDERALPEPETPAKRRKAEGN